MMVEILRGLRHGDKNISRAIHSSCCEIRSLCGHVRPVLRPITFEHSTPRVHSAKRSDSQRSLNNSPSSMSFHSAGGAIGSKADGKTSALARCLL